MTGTLLRRAVATSLAVTVGGWATFAVSAAADPVEGQGPDAAANHAQGHAQGQGQGQGQATGKDPKGPKDGHGQGHSQAHGQGQATGKDPKGPKDGQGQEGGQGGQSPGGAEGGAHTDPPGNNGTVKITPHLEDDGVPQNTPHVSCIVDIEWYGFDEGADIVSTVEFAMQAPTSDVAVSGTEPSQVFVGGDPATGAGTDSGFDGEATYRLAFDGEPHPKQGYHVKLTVHTPGSQGADTKHKVFWVQPCTDETATAPSAAGTPTTGEPQPAGDEVTTPTASYGVLGTQAAAAVDDDDDDERAGASADVPTRVDAGAEGSLVSDVTTSPVMLLLVAMGLAFGGMALVVRRRAF